MISSPRFDIISEVKKYRRWNEKHTADQLYGFSGSPSSQDINFRVVGGGSSLEELPFREGESALSSVSILYLSSASASSV